MDGKIEEKCWIRRNIRKAVVALVDLCMFIPSPVRVSIIYIFQTQQQHYDFLSILHNNFAKLCSSCQLQCQFNWELRLVL